MKFLMRVNERFKMSACLNVPELLQQDINILFSPILCIDPISTQNCNRSVMRSGRRQARGPTEAVLRHNDERKRDRGFN